MGDSAGMQLVALLPPGADDVAIASKFPRLSATVYALSECYLRPPPRGGLMIGYANLGGQEVPAVV
jgi:GntR family transcriptional regulator/MocR family aminotransferase